MNEQINRRMLDLLKSSGHNNESQNSKIKSPFFSQTSVLPPKENETNPSVTRAASEELFDMSEKASPGLLTFTSPLLRRNKCSASQSIKSASVDDKQQRMNEKNKSNKFSNELLFSETRCQIHSPHTTSSTHTSQTASSRDPKFLSPNQMNQGFNVRYLYNLHKTTPEKEKRADKLRKHRRRKGKTSNGGTIEEELIKQKDIIPVFARPLNLQSRQQELLSQTQPILKYSHNANESQYVNHYVKSNNGLLNPQDYTKRMHALSQTALGIYNNESFTGTDSTSLAPETRERVDKKHKTRKKKRKDKTVHHSTAQHIGYPVAEATKHNAHIIAPVCNAKVTISNSKLLNT